MCMVEERGRNEIAANDQLFNSEINYGNSSDCVKIQEKEKLGQSKQEAQ